MVSAATATVLKTMESLPEPIQERVVEHFIGTNPWSTS
jgi:hypothetical protein